MVEGANCSGNNAKGAGMMKDEEDVKFENYCKMVDQYSPCMDDYPFVYDLKNDLYFISDKVLERFSMETNLFSDVTETLKKIVYPADFPELEEDLRKLMSGEKDEHSIRYRWIGKDGKPIWIDCRGRVLRDEDGSAAYMLGCVNEIGRSQLADNVSGLWSINAMEEYLSEYEGNYPDGYFMYLGLDDFKTVMERKGMKYANASLYQLSKRIFACIGSKQMAYRAVSDEFVIMDFNGGTMEDAENLYHRVREAVDQYIEDSKYEVVYTISAGCVFNRDLQQQNYSEVMKLARFALGRARDLGRNQLYYYNKTDYEHFLYQRNLLRAMRKAVSNNYEGFELYFQPITNAGTGTLYAAESLCRFFMDGRMVSPMEFIPLLEDSGLIIPVGRWIVDKALEMCKECRKVFPDFKITVNISYVQIKKSPIANAIFQALDKYELPSDSLIVELTESGYLSNTPAIQKVWERLRERGVMIAVDDFGTGYSDMEMLGNLEPNILKIDRGFTLQALSREYMNHLLSNIIHMSHNMELMVCVEGVETEDELTRVCSLDPNFIQGFYYGKPCCKEDFLAKFIYCTNEQETA